MLFRSPKADDSWLDDLLRGISDGAPELAKGDTGRFMNAVALRVAPPRSSTTKPKADTPKTKPTPAPDIRSAMQKLMDKFR